MCFHFPPFSWLLLPCFSFSVRLLELFIGKSAPFPYYCNCPTELHLYVYTYLFMVSVAFCGLTCTHIFKPSPWPEGICNSPLISVLPWLFFQIPYSLSTCIQLFFRTCIHFICFTTSICLVLTQVHAASSVFIHRVLRGFLQSPLNGQTNLLTKTIYLFQLGASPDYLRSFLCIPFSDPSCQLTPHPHIEVATSFFIHSLDFFSCVFFGEHVICREVYSFSEFLSPNVLKG